MDVGKYRKYLLQLGGPLIITFAFAVLIAVSWRKWMSILIDFGRELYVSWQLVEGKILYHDIAYFNGPLSPYINALWFYLFGVSFTSLFICNLALLWLLTIIIYYFVLRLSDRLTATMACMVFLVVFAFNHLMFAGNFNFVTPYSHEAVHGIFSSMVAMAVLSQVFLSQNKMASIIVGLSTGAVFLTKPEIFVALSFSLVMGFVAFGFFPKSDLKHNILNILLIVISFFLPVLGFFLYFFPYVGAKRAFFNLMGAWPHIFNTEVVNLAFYKMLSGRDHLWLNMGHMVWGLFLLLLILAAAVLFNQAMLSARRRGHPASWVLFCSY